MQDAPAAPAGNVDFTDWPKKGWDGPQPWDLEKQGLTLEQRQLDEGAPDTISPVRIRHRHPVITVGAQGPQVGELARRLHALGYKTDIGTVANPFTVLTDNVLGAVERFRDHYGVLEDPTAWGGSGPKSRAQAALHVGPYTWEALIRESDRVVRANVVA